MNEAVGEFLRIDPDQELYAYFRRHFSDFFPGLRIVHRTTFARQAAHLWALTSRLWQHLVAAARRDPALALIDSLPVPAGQFARAYRCRGFPGLASFGHDALAHRTDFGLRLHLCVTWSGVITTATLAPAHVADLARAPELLARQTGWALGGGADGSPRLREEVALQGLALLAPPRGAAARAGAGHAGACRSNGGLRPC